MALLIIPAILLGGIAIALFALAIAGAVLSVVLRIFAGVLWIAIKIVERLSTAEPEILIVISEDDQLMRDVTPRKATPRINAPRR